MFEHATSRPDARIAVLLLPRFSNLCLAAVIEPLRAANEGAGRVHYRWIVVSEDGGPVTSSSGVRVAADRALSEVAVGGVLLVLASYGYRRAATGRLKAALRHHARHGTLLGGLDTGAWLLAEAGLLDGYRATIHHEELAVFAERFPRVRVVEDRYVVDRDRLTAGGATAALDLVLAEIRRRHGPTLADRVATLFLYTAEAPADRPQGAVPEHLLARFDTRLARAVALMRRQTEPPLPLAVLAARLGLSARSLERLFRRHLDTTPRDYYRELRLAQARGLLMESALPVAEIALRTGFESAAAFSRSFRRRYGLAPRELRRSRGVGGASPLDSGRSLGDRSGCCPKRFG